MKPLWIILAALLLALALHYWLGIGVQDLLWDPCMPSPPTPERPWHDFTRCAKGGK